MRKTNLAITITLFALAIACYIVFGVIKVRLLEEEIANTLLTEAISRFLICLVFVWMLYSYGGKDFFIFDRTFFRSLIWALPCFMVAVVNFPFSALSKGIAQIERTDLLGLYALYILSVAFLEEFIFRGVLYLLINDVLNSKKHKIFFTVLICSLLFSLFHLTNLFAKASIGDTLLQCLYTFLIGAMLMVTLIKTKNIWLCILIHALFDFGGLLYLIGVENMQDDVFWILTIISGVLCAGHIIYTLIKLEKDYVSR